jgi:hypothetical protein
LVEIFPRLKIYSQHAVWTERLKTLSFRCALDEDCKHLCVQGEVWWKGDTMRIYNYTESRVHPDMSNVNKIIRIEAKRISTHMYIVVSLTSQ